MTDLWSRRRTCVSISFSTLEIRGKKHFWIESWNRLDFRKLCFCASKWDKLCVISRNNMNIYWLSTLHTLPFILSQTGTLVFLSLSSPSPPFCLFPVVIYKHNYAISFLRHLSVDGGYYVQSQEQKERVWKVRGQGDRAHRGQVIWPYQNVKQSV